MKPGILVIDIGGSGIKAAVVDEQGNLLSERLRVLTPHPCLPSVLIDTVVELVAPCPAYNRISIGFPGAIRNGLILTAANLDSREWIGFDLPDALSRRLGNHPARIINDADLQGFALIQGKGLEMVITLGTGFGSALFRDGQLMPHLELAHHPVSDNLTYDQYLGNAALKKIDVSEWNERLLRVLDVLEVLLHADHIVLTGGNVRLVTVDLPPSVSIAPSDSGISGGAALWRHRT
ncbi:ROK family protein [Pseudomonas sp. gcc21]|uniref:ROK family protein n=1 Tax=Pseudomonas sp. gcc21 TaxID=2726989 RepID=UPI001452A1AF|nr:ROK family protein [Pseudomonas sp. gcc21]QJD59692.1 ROK family protein [Pseudomonas sp. gcc21]